MYAGALHDQRRSALPQFWFISDLSQSQKSQNGSVVINSPRPVAFSAFPLTATVERVMLLVSLLSSPCNNRAF